MVSYQSYVKIAFDVADDKGAQFDGIEAGGDFMSQIAEFWSQNKQTLKGYTKAQTREEMRRQIQ